MTSEFFFYLFGVLVLLCAYMHYLSRKNDAKASSKSNVEAEEAKKEEEEESAFKRFQRNYLLVYYIVMGKDLPSIQTAWYIFLLTPNLYTDITPPASKQTMHFRGRLASGPLRLRVVRVIRIS